MPRTLTTRAALASLLLAAPAAAQDLEGFRIPYDDFVLYDADGDPATDGDQVRLTGQIGLDLVPFVCSSWDPSTSCQHVLEAGGEVTGLASFSVDAGLAASVDELWLTDPGLPPLLLLTVPVGGVDVTVSLRFLGALSASGSIGAQTHFDAAFEAPFSAAMEFDPGLAFDVALPQPDQLLTSKPELTGGAAASFTVGAFAAVEFQVAVAGIPVPSPSFLVGPEVTLQVAPAADPWWSIDGDLAVYAAFGSLPAGFLVPPQLLASLPLAGADAGGAIGDAGQLDDPRWAQTLDLGGYDEATFVLPRPGDPWSTVIGVDSNTGVVEVDRQGQVIDAWHWVGARPSDGTPSASGTLLAGAVGSSVWFADYAGGGSFGFSKRVEVYEQGNWRWFIPERVVTLPEGDFVLGGTTSVAGNVNRRTLMRVDPQGQVVWVKMFGYGYLGDSFADMILTSDGALVMVGRYDESGATPGALVTKVSAEGQRVWSSVVPDQGGNVRRATAVTETDSGELLVMGHRSIGALVPDPDFTIWTRTVDLVTGASDQEYLHGALQGTVAVFGMSVRDRAYDVVPLGAGFAMVGKCSEQVEEDAWIWVLGAEQSLIEVGVYDTPLYDSLSRVRTLPDGGLLAVGNSRGFSGNSDSDLLLVKAGASPLVDLAAGSGGTSTHYAMGTFPNHQQAVAQTIVTDELTWVSNDYVPGGLAPFATTTVTDIEE
ncbi:hypothetical protein [Engelhardtia mirabilis]|uniref:Uncharacterized protein n=1 Tax=Engelhardtia mirabilis TaxID=2528011 RepID=A0A518BMC9_9BACT|nr:hypothetical protein Pla133_32280 [Planctomycetes bacterium Pla133]QDV02460.1 hypothetical protein Pla86_32270 [Planctomycetes bacterium Pla86]